MCVCIYIYIYIYIYVYIYVYCGKKAMQKNLLGTKVSCRWTDNLQPGTDMKLSIPSEVVSHHLLNSISLSLLC